MIMHLTPIHGAAVALAATAILAASLSAEPPVAESGLPSVDEILRRHIDALGGEEAIHRHRFRTREGKIAIPDLEIEGAVRFLAAAPHLFLMEADLGEHGINRTGFNGVIGWSNDEINGPTLLSDARLEELRRQADFYADLNFPKHYSSIQLLGLSTFNEQQTYELKMVDRSGKDVFAYFSVDSGLQVGLKGMYESHEGPIPAKTIIADYERFEGVLVPMRYETHFREIVQHITLESIHHELIEEEKFELPEAVLALPGVKADEPRAE